MCVYILKTRATSTAFSTCAWVCMYVCTWICACTHTCTLAWLHLDDVLDESFVEGGLPAERHQFARYGVDGLALHVHYIVHYIVHYLVHYTVHCMVHYMVHYIVHYIVHNIVHNIVHYIVLTPARPLRGRWSRLTWFITQCIT